MNKKDKNVAILCFLIGMVNLYIGIASHSPFNLSVGVACIGGVIIMAIVG